MEFSEAQKAKMLKYLLAGLAVGGGTNLTLNLMSYLADKKKDLSDAEQKEKEAKGLNRVIYEIDPKEYAWLEKEASVKTAEEGVAGDTLTQALAILALTGGLYGGYRGADILHDKLRRSELEAQQQEELENYNKKLYLLAKAKAKTASENLTKIAAFSDIAGIGLGALLLTALGSAWASREFLKKQYPKLNLEKTLNDQNSLMASLQTPALPLFIEKEIVKTDSDEPKNLDKDENEEPIEDEEKDPFAKLEKLSFDKQASYVNEAIIGLCYELEKKGKQGSATNIIKSAAIGLTEPIKEATNKYNASYTVFDAVDALEHFHKEASIDPVREQVAITWLATEPQVSKAIMPQMCAELLDHMPILSKVASELNAPNLEHIVTGLLSTAVIQKRQNTFKDLAFSKEAHTKIASEDNTIHASNAELLENLLQNLLPIQEQVKNF